MSDTTELPASQDAIQAESVGTTTEEPGRYERITTLLAVVLGVAGVILTLVRLLYGADFLDESFYAAEAYHFALGARPFIDQIDVHQTAALITEPWVRLHLLVFGDTTGIMLSLRLLWAILNGAAAVLSFQLLRRFIDWRVAMIAAVTSFSIMPFMIPAPSFNTLGVIFGSMAVSLVGLGVTDRSGPLRFVLAGATLGLATFAYPTLAIPAVFVVLAAWWLARSWKQPVFVLAGGAGVALAGAAVLAPYFSGISKVLAAAGSNARWLDWGGASEGGPAAKLLVVLQSQWFWSSRSASAWIAVAVGALQAAKRRVPAWLVGVMIVTLPLEPFGLHVRGDVRTLTQCTVILFAALVVAFTQRAPREARGSAVLRFAVLYGVVAGLVFSVTSSNGWLVVGLGGAAVLAPSLAVIFQRLDTSLTETRAGELIPLLRVLAAGVILASFLWFNMTGGYRDLPPMQLGARVTSGPHAGLITTAANAEDSERLWTTLKSIAGPKDRLLAYHALPVAYLFSAARPALSTIWLNPGDALGLQQVTTDQLTTLAQPANRPTIVVKNLGWPDPQFLALQNPLGYDPSKDRLERFIQDRYHVAYATPSWQILLPNAAP